MRQSLAAALLLAACSASAPPGPHPLGSESFTSSPPGARGVVPTAGGPGAEPVDAPQGSPRAVEEGDVYQLAGTRLYALNAWRGLQIVDLSDLAAPRLLGRAPVSGTPVELYLRGDVALVATREDLVYAFDAVAGVPRPWLGSRVSVIDVSDPARPAILAELPIEGQLLATRLVGDVLYLVSRRSPYWYGGMGPIGPVGGAVTAALEPLPEEDAVLVASIDLADPRAPRAVDAVGFPASGWETHAHVTSERITLSAAGWDSGGSPTTRFRAVDISDPGGALVLGAETAAPGLARSRWGLDFDAASGLFRAVVENGWNAGARLLVYRWAQPQAVSQAGELVLDVAESLTAARFDGARVYAVTALRMDPLWVIDTSDPARPVLAGHLEMPGQLDHVEPRGDRLLALGHTNEAGSPFQLHVSLIDVAQASAPALLSRATFGPDWGFVPAVPDDLHKAFLVLDGEGLVVVPWQGWDAAGYAWRGGTQLLSFGPDALALGGFLAHAGSVKRAFPVGAGRLAALSDERLQTIDATDRSRPVEIASIDLARPVRSIAVVNGRAVEACGDGWRSGAEIVVVPAESPEDPSPPWRSRLEAYGARLFADGPVVWVLATGWSGPGSLSALDLSVPESPAWGGRVELPQGAGGGGWWWGAQSDAVRAGRALAVMRSPWYSPGGEGEVLLYDLSDAAAPRLAGAFPAPGAGWMGGLLASGPTVWLSSYEWVDDGTWSAVRYHVDRIDVSDPAAPRLLPRVNVPGVFFAASEDGVRLYTWELVWPVPGQPGAPTQPTTWVHALALTDHGTARLEASVQLPGYFSGLVAGMGHGYGASSAWGQDAPGRLAAVRLDPLQIAGEQALEAPWAEALAVAGEKLFLNAHAPLGALLVYDLASPGAPAFEQAAPGAGFGREVVVAEGRAYVAAGEYGVLVVPLAAPGAP